MQILRMEIVYVINPFLQSGDHVDLCGINIAICHRTATGLGYVC